jgi:hypothetical protein
VIHPARPKIFNEFQGFGVGPGYLPISPVFKFHKTPRDGPALNAQPTKTMKTKNHIAVIATALSIVLAASASAVPASKRIGPRQASATSSSTASSKVEHKAMKHVGPAGKGYDCNH